MTESELAPWRPPTWKQMARVRRLLSPWLWMTSPPFFGVECVPRDRPVMFRQGTTP